MKLRLPEKLLTTSSLLVRPALLGIKVDGIDEVGISNTSTCSRASMICLRKISLSLMAFW